MDPTCSVIMIIILVNAGVPLLKETMKILLQTSTVESTKIKEELQKIPEVAGVHDLHIW